MNIFIKDDPFLSFQYTVHIYFSRTSTSAMRVKCIKHSDIKTGP